MVKLNKIYTRTGDDGSTGLASGERRPKCDTRVEAYGDVDEANSAVGLARLSTAAMPELDAMLERIQNDLFDLGADLATPPSEKPLGYEPLRIAPTQVVRLEQEIDALNARLAPLRSFVLPGGSAAAAALHLARAVCRRAERRMVALVASGESVGEPTLQFINRLSDFLFVAARIANNDGAGDILWKPGKNR
ncbi:cob(I)yrinic acid a,c-diamide adenosyltransferase [Rhodoblastus sp.]|uniref:cob(I)yrinic acid a,c-diamide adenosyltransferase n=1 Tax=Rhodoblastus sp. TaxID=1962975 RepID=UPI002608BC3C|nr:cob(I)yrinic acid a,c-diamide adenosyltransferase [Rhodoblastus sp.]